MTEPVREFFVLSTRSIEIAGDASCGTKYSLESACKFCGSSAFPIGDRIVKAIPQKSGRIFFTDAHELIIDDRVGSALQSLGIDTFAKVIDPQSRVLPFKELRPEITLPPFSKLTTGYEIEDPCKHCLRDGFFHVPKTKLNLIYENIDPAFFQYNILATYELFGTSCKTEPFSESVFAHPKLIVSDKVVSILRAESIEFVSFEPVKILTAHSVI